MAGVGLGATLAIVVVRNLNSAKEAFTPQGVSRGIDKAVTSVKDIVGEVRTAVAEREQELRANLLHGEPTAGTVRDTFGAFGAFSRKAPDTTNDEEPLFEF
jgi:hypothetical protein